MSSLRDLFRPVAVSTLFAVALFAPARFALAQSVKPIQMPARRSLARPPALNPHLTASSHAGTAMPASAPLLNPIFGQLYSASAGVPVVGIASADFNGDGIPDLAVSGGQGDYSHSTFAAYVSIFLGYGDGTYQLAHEIQIPGQGSDNYLAVGDLNGDGFQDIVTSNRCYNTACAGSVSILYGNGDGTFQAPQTMNTGLSDEKDIVIRDFNKDGQPDIAVLDGAGPCNSSDFTLFINQGGGSFQTLNQTNNGICGEGYSGMDAGDVNGDGIQDLVMAGNNPGGDSGVRIWTGNGDGTFSSAGFFPSGGVAPESVVVADVNGDGYPDLVVSNFCLNSTDGCAEGSVGIALGDNSGTFSSVTTYPAGQGTVYAAVGHLKRGGNLDVVASNTDGTVTVLVNQGAGLFNQGVSYGFGQGRVYTWVIADLNQDGNGDIALADLASARVKVALGSGDGTLPEFQAGSAGVIAVSAAFGDVNGDGKPDVVVANSNIHIGTGNGDVGVLLGNGDGTFHAAVPYNSGGVYALSITVGDVNGDGKLDLLVTNSCIDVSCLNGGVAVLLGNGDGTFQGAVAYGSGGRYAYSTAVGDVNGDGKPDLLVTNGDSSTVGVLLGNGDGTFQAAVPYRSGGVNAYSTAVGDVNGDGKPDLLVANQCDNNCTSTDGVVGVLLGNGDGTFQAAVPYRSGGVYALSITVGDVNGDGKPDLLVANQCIDYNDCMKGGLGGGSVGVLLGNGDGTFQAAVAYGSGGRYARGIAVGDVNGDGKPDLLTANLCIDTSCTNADVGVLLGNGDGTFQGAVAYSSGDPDLGLFFALGDLNGDGKLDLVMPHESNPGSVVVLRNIFDAPAASSANLASSIKSLMAFQPVVLTANITSSLVGTPTGTVQFESDGTPLSGVTVDGTGQAVLNTSALGAGQHFVFAKYSGDNSYAPSNSYGFYLSVSPAQTSTAITAAPATTMFGQAVTLTATVSSTYGSPAGTVTFLDGGAPIGSASLTGGVATLLTATLGAGTHTITASYGGETNFSTSTSSNAATQTVNQASSAVALSSSTASSVYGQVVTFTAGITLQYGGGATGTVTFKDGGSVLGSVPVMSDGAALQTSLLGAGTHTITAVYNGDGNVQPSTSAGISQTVSLATTSTVLGSSRAPILIGQSVTFTANVTGQGGTLSGSIAFKNGANTMATVALVNGAASYTRTFPSAGARSITAVYSGDTNNQGSTSMVVTEAVLASPAATTTVLGSSSTNPNVGQPVTFTATVTSTYGPIPNGDMVAFKDATTTPAVILATLPLTGGVATFTTAALPYGTRSIKATYLGNTDFAASVSPLLTETVQRYTTTTTVASSVNPSATGQTVMFTATVSSVSGVTPPDGEVITFQNSGVVLGTALLANGHATLTKAFAAAGTKSITASYPGDATNRVSTSSALSQVVKPAATTTVLVASPNPSTVGQSVMLTASLTGQFGGTPSGTVTFMNGTTTMGTATLSGGQASFNKVFPTTGMKSLTVIYSGDANFATSTGALTQTVN